MEEHIHAVIRYAENSENCRSAMLLEYFGEKNSTSCKQCDYCIRHKEREITKADWEQVESMSQCDVAVISQRTGISEHKVIEILRQIGDDG